MKFFLLAITLLIASCGGGKPENITPVEPFDVQRYLGTWYEIARLDHRFERGLSNVTAEYSLRDDGGIKVLNRGYSEKEGKWNEAEGKAYFADRANTGHLKVSFWGPFYSSYVVFELDEINYQYAVISGSDKGYLWILARQPSIDPNVLEKLIAKAKALGFETEKLITVDHSGPSKK